MSQLGLSHRSLWQPSLCATDSLPLALMRGKVLCADVCELGASEPRLE